MMKEIVKYIVVIHLVDKSIITNTFTNKMEAELFYESLKIGLKNLKVNGYIEMTPAKGSNVYKRTIVITSNITYIEINKIEG